MRHEEATFTGHDGLELYCQSWHPDGLTKASLVIVHGLGEHSGRYMNLVNVLVTDGYAVSAFDIRGHGRSPGRRGHVGRFSEFRKDVEVFVRRQAEKQAPDQPLFLMGHSLGGLIVLDHVLHGSSGLAGVIISAPALETSGVSAILIAASKVLSYIWPALSVKTGLDGNGISRDPGVLIAYEKDPQVHGRGTPRLATEISRTISWCLANADRLQIPILMIHGTGDMITSPQSSRDFLDKVTCRDKTYIAYEGGYHESHNDLHHQQTTADVKNWLNQRLQQSTG